MAAYISNIVTDLPGIFDCRPRLEPGEIGLNLVSFNATCGYRSSWKTPRRSGAPCRRSCNTSDLRRLFRSAAARPATRASKDIVRCVRRREAALTCARAPNAKTRAHGSFRRAICTGCALLLQPTLSCEQHARICRCQSVRTRARPFVCMRARIR